MSRWPENHPIPVLRPGNTLIWLPVWLMRKMKLKKSQRLNQDQFDSLDVQNLISERLTNETGRKKG